MRMTRHLVTAYVWLSLANAMSRLGQLLLRAGVRCIDGDDNASARFDCAIAKFRVLYDARWPKP